MNLHTRWRLLAVLLVVGQLQAAQSSAQSTAAPAGLTDSLATDDQNMLAAVAAYPRDTRAAILSVAQYPDGLAQLAKEQARTAEQFRALIDRYPRAEQESAYDAARYPQALQQLGKLGAGRQQQADAILEAYPDDARKPIAELYRLHFDDLVRMNAIYEQSQNVLQATVSTYPTQVKNDFETVVALPEVMQLLTDDPEQTESLGQAYRSDPRGLDATLDTLHTDIESNTRSDVADYQRRLDESPQLQAEALQAEKEFVRDNDEPKITRTVVVNNYTNTTPYAYWYGYPRWYRTPMWYRRPRWYHSGFYYGPGGRLVVVGLPSRQYGYWYFRAGRRRYPRLYMPYHTYCTVHRARVVNVRVYGGTLHRGYNNAATRHYANRPPVRHSRTVITTRPGRTVVVKPNNRQSGTEYRRSGGQQDKPARNNVERAPRPVKNKPAKAPKAPKPEKSPRQRAPR
jgi:hypothetical protein